MNDEPLIQLVERLQIYCLDRGMTAATAESCTGGLVAKLITDVAGSSGYFHGGIVSYSNEAKQGFLGVPAEQLAAHGAVSAQVARSMALGALARTGAGSALWQSWWEATRSGDFSPGPLWFAEALLLFAGGYAIWCKLRPAPLEVMELPSFGALALSALFLACVSFLVRLWTPVGTQVAWLQIGYFPCYIFLFAVGCAAGRSRLLERITLGEARP